MKYVKKGQFIIFILFFLACDTEPFEVDSGGGTQVNRRLVITVEHRYDSGARLDSLLPNAEVEMYLDPQDRTEEINLDRTRTTGFNGEALVEYLEDTTYYLRIKHATRGIRLLDVEITANTSTAYEYILYQ
jgi:hypothetical protein